MNFDILITNGTIFDGIQDSPFHCDIGINDNLITNMGDLSGADSEKIVDATDLTVCPGFIDTHSHSDVYLLLEPTAASKIYQGITTEICGNCGASAAPLMGDYKMPADWCAQLDSLAERWEARGQDSEVNGQTSEIRNQHRTADILSPLPQNRTPGFRPAPAWSTVAQYRDLYNEMAPAINIGLLIGHNTLHAGICGYDPRGATPDELALMQKELEKALDEGGLGLSSGLAYPPGSAVPAEELIALCKTVAKHDGVYTTHMRSESAGLLESIDEALNIAEKSGVRLHISHLKASGETNWSKLSAALGKIRAAIASGLPIGSDRYPYTAGSTDLDILLPQWATYGGRDAILARIRDDASRQRIRRELMDHPPGYWDNVMIGYTRFEAFRGKYLPEVADALHMNEVDAFFHLIDADELKTGGVFFSMAEDNLWKVLAEPYVSLGSDGSMRAPWGPLSSDFPHPRAYGSHSRFLRAALDGKTVPLGEAIRKMTALPAEQFGLQRRGVLKEGYAADILIFDPEKIRENSTYATPHRLSEGMRHVFVNGVHSLMDGKHAQQRGGTFLSGFSR